jgi:hypothetical protein
VTGYRAWWLRTNSCQWQRFSALPFSFLFVDPLCLMFIGCWRLFHELQWLEHKAGHLPYLVPKSKMPLFSFHFLHFSWILHWNFLHFGPICKYLFSLHTKLILDSNVSSAFSTLLASWILLEIMVQTVKPVNIFSCFSVPFNAFAIAVTTCLLCYVFNQDPIAL